MNIKSISIVTESFSGQSLSDQNDYKSLFLPISGAVLLEIMYQVPIMKTPIDFTPACIEGAEMFGGCRPHEIPGISDQTRERQKIG